MHLENLGNSVNAIKDIQNVLDYMSQYKGLGVAPVTIEKLEQATSGYSTEVLKLATSQVALSKNQATAIFTAKGLSGAELDAAVKAAMLSTAEKEATTSTLGLGTAFKGLGASIKSFVVNNPALTFAALATAAIAAGVAIYANLHPSLEAASKDLKDKKEEFDSITQEVSDLSKELEESKKRMAELQSLGSLSLVESEELSKLKETTAELETQLAIKKEELRMKAKETATAADKAFNGTFRSKYDEDGNLITGDAGHGTDPVKELENSIKAYYKLQEQYNSAKLNADFFAKETEKNGGRYSLTGKVNWAEYEKYAKQMDSIQKQMDSASAQANKMYETLNGQKEAYEGLYNAGYDLNQEQTKEYETIRLNTEAYNNFCENINDTAKAFSELSAEQKRSKLVTQFILSGKSEETAKDIVKSISDDDLDIAAKIRFDSSATKESAKKAIEAAKDMDIEIQGEITFDDALNSLPIDKIEELIALFKSGTIDENTISSYDDLNAIIQETGLNAEEAVKALKEFSEDYTLSSQLISDMDSTIALIAKLKDELEQTGTLGVDSLSALAKQFPELEYAVSQFNQGLISTDDLIALLQTAYENDADAFRTAMSLKLSGNETFFETIKNNNQTFFDNLAKAYDLDVGNWKTLAQAKAQIDQELIKNLSTAWSKYYNIVYDATGIASLEGGTDYSKVGTQDPTYDYNPDVQQAWYKANEQVKQYNKYIEQLNELANIEIDVSNFGGIKPEGYKGSGSGKDKKEKEPTIFDWIAVAAEQSEKKIEKLQNKLNDTSGWKPKNTITDTTIDEMANKLTSLQAMADSYQKAADSYDLSPTYIDKIKNGTLEIESVTDEVIAKNIKSYQEWYDKAEDMRKQIDETKRSMKELAQSKLDNIINDFNSLTSLMGKYTDYLSGLLDLQDSLGESISDTDYRDLIDQQEAIYNQLQNKYNTLNAELKNAVDSGAIEVGSEEWRKYNEELIDVNSSMKDAVSSMNEFRQSILNLSFKELDAFADKIDRINQGTNTLLNILGDDGLMDNGMITAKGLAQLALYGQQYANAKQQAAEYANAIDALNDMYHNGSITEAEYNERLNEYTSAQLSAVEVTKEAEQAILQFRYDAIQAQIDDMNKLIDAKKKALQSEKDYQDYLESISNKQNDINNLQKKIDELALSSDRRDIAQRLELEKQLSDAKKELSDLEADYSYDQTMEGLDKEAEEYEEAKNNELKELKESYEKQQEVIKKYLSQVKDNYETVYKTLTEYGINYNVSMTDELTNPWSSADNAVNSFTDAVSSAVSQINIEISNIDLSRLTELIDMMNEFSDTAHGMGGAGSSNYEDATGRGSWKKAADGKRWWYGNSADDFVSDGIYTINGKQYGFDENGYMQTEWQNHNGDYYYFDANNGHMIKSQWIPGNDGKQYYLTADGTMATDMAIKDKKDGDKYYYVDEDGVWDGETINYEEVKDRDLKVGYKNGTKNATPGWHPVNENGFEYVLTKEGALASFGGGEKVFSNEMSNKLWELAANPAQFIMEANRANLSNMRLDKSAAYSPVEITGPLVVVEGVMDEKMVGQLRNMMNKWATKELPDIMRKDMKGR